MFQNSCSECLFQIYLFENSRFNVFGCKKMLRSFLVSKFPFQNPRFKKTETLTTKTLSTHLQQQRLRQRELSQNQTPYFNNFNSQGVDFNIKKFEHKTSATKISTKRTLTKPKSVVIIIARRILPQQDSRVEIMTRRSNGRCRFRFRW